MRAMADAVVIGGGVMGTSIAFRLAERGLKVTLVERCFLAGGTTGKSSAVIRQHYSNELTARMALHSLRIFQNFAEAVGGECGYVRTGFILLAHESDRGGLEANVAMQRKVGIDAEVLDAQALREVASSMAEIDQVSAAYEPEGGYADPTGTVQSFAAAARRHGAEILLDTEVRSIRMAAGRVRRVHTSAGEIACAAVVNAAGPWAGRLMRDLGIDLPIQPCRAQIALFSPPPDERPAPFVFGDFPNKTYFRPETGGMTLLGSVDPAEAEDRADPDHHNERVDFEFILEAGAGLARRFPCMERSQSRGGYSGIYDVTPDWHPILDEVPPGSGLFIAAGHSGHGFKLAPAVGSMMADLMLGERRVELDPKLLRFSRYARGKPVVGRYEYSIVG